MSEDDQSLAYTRLVANRHLEKFPGHHVSYDALAVWCSTCQKSIVSETTNAVLDELTAEAQRLGMYDDQNLKPQTPVKVGQIWEDWDIRNRASGCRRQLKVLAIENGKAVVQSPSGMGARTRIRLDRFKPTTTGYRLVRDVSP